MEDQMQVEKAAARGSLVVISGPSGVGKGTVCKALIAKHPNIICSISATTRPMRKGEVDGKDYFFLSQAEFKKRIAADDFLEWAEVYGNYYGTLQKTVEDRLAAGFEVILEIDTEGAKQIKQKLGNDALLIYIMPPSIEELEKRLRGRSTDSEEVILKRLSCYKGELAQRKYYDFMVTNLNVDKAVAQVEQIINQKAGSLRGSRNE